MHRYAAAMVVACLSMIAPALAQDAPTQIAGPQATEAATRVEGPHVLLQDEAVTVLWASGQERREVTLDRSETIDVPAWRGAPEIKALPLAPPAVGPSGFEAPERIFVLGDIHGRFEPFVQVLRHAGVIDNEDRWTFGASHLVCCGDLMDRGAGVDDALWLLHRLEREAERAGGKVHVLLGNHEHMVIQNDLRYLHPDLVDASKVIGVAYPDLYGHDTVLGRWLRTRHSIIKIGDLAFVHGGVGPTLLRHAEQRDLNYDDINRLVREHFDDDKQRTKADPLLSDLFGSAGPLWHRGYFRAGQKYDPASDADIDRALHWLGAKAIVVGHSQFDRVGTHHDRKIIATDVNLERTPEGVLIEGDRWFRLTTSGQPTPLAPLGIE